MAKKIAKTYLSHINGLQVLDDRQWVNVACMTLPDSCVLCVFDEQGAGKTVTLIFAFDVLVERDEAYLALIIAPKSMISEWPIDVANFMPDRYKVRSVIGKPTREGKSSLKLELYRLVSKDDSFRIAMQDTLKGCFLYEMYLHTHLTA